MIKLRFEESWAESDCDTCGSNYDNGLQVYVDDELVIDHPASPSCFGGENIEISQNGYSVIAQLIEHITGKKVEFSVESEDYTY